MSASTVDTIVVPDTANTVSFVKHEFVYIDDGASPTSHASYHKITAVYNTDASGNACANSAYCRAEFTPAFTGSTANTITGETGVYYSDPTDTYGVSEACNNVRTYTTSTIVPHDTAAKVATKLKALSSVISALTVTRTHSIDNSSGKLGYTWTVTFTHNNGDQNLLACTTTSLTTSAGTSQGEACNVVEYTKGALLDGYFDLQLPYPHVYVGAQTT
jgi:hypothetical protein